jgi:hypothetical protein
MKKKPKAWNKMTIQEQEVWLQGRHMELSELLSINQKELARVRGGFKIELSDDLQDRPDLNALKSD